MDGMTAKNAWSNFWSEWHPICHLERSRKILVVEQFPKALKPRTLHVGYCQGCHDCQKCRNSSV